MVGLLAVIAAWLGVMDPAAAAPRPAASQVTHAYDFLRDLASAAGANTYRAPLTASHEMLGSGAVDFVSYVTSARLHLAPSVACTSHEHARRSVQLSGCTAATRTGAGNLGRRARAHAGETVAANAGARTFGNFAMSDLRAAAQAADRNGLTQVGRALQKHSGRDGSVFNGLSSGSATARNEQGLRVLDDILNDPAGRTEVLDRVTNIWDSTGRGVRYGNDGSFMGFLEPVG